MNRRNAIRAAIGAMVAAVFGRWWWKRPDIVAITPEGIEPLDGFTVSGDPVYLDLDHEDIKAARQYLDTLAASGMLSRNEVRRLEERCLPPPSA